MDKIMGKDGCLVKFGKDQTGQMKSYFTNHAEVDSFSNYL